jgi:hypothetical protein
MSSSSTSSSTAASKKRKRAFPSAELDAALADVRGAQTVSLDLYLAHLRPLPPAIYLKTLAYLTSESILSARAVEIVFAIVSKSKESRLAFHSLTPAFVQAFPSIIANSTRLSDGEIAMLREDVHKLFSYLATNYQRKYPKFVVGYRFLLERGGSGGTINFFSAHVTVSLAARLREREREKVRVEAVRLCASEVEEVTRLCSECVSSFKILLPDMTRDDDDDDDDDENNNDNNNSGGVVGRGGRSSANDMNGVGAGVRDNEDDEEDNDDVDWQEGDENTHAAAVKRTIDMMRVGQEEFSIRIRLNNNSGGSNGDNAEDDDEEENGNNDGNNNDEDTNNADDVDAFNTNGNDNDLASSSQPNSIIRSTLDENINALSKVHIPKIRKWVEALANSNNDASTEAERRAVLRALVELKMKISTTIAKNETIKSGFAAFLPPPAAKATNQIPHFLRISNLRN